MRVTRASRLVTVVFAFAAVVCFADDGKNAGASEEKPWYELVKIDAELRTRLEGLINYSPSFPADSSHAYTLARTRLGIKAKPNKHVWAYIQLQDSRIWGEEPSVTSATDNVDLHQAFVVWDKIGDSNLSIKLGRQELSFGDERLVGAFGWSNIGRSFDAVKVSFKDRKYRIDGFYATTRETLALETDASFGGIYASFGGTPAGTLEGYALFKIDDRSIFASEIAPSIFGSLNIQTFGFRAVGPGGKSPFRFGAEVAFQTGDYGEDSHSAWAAHVRGGYKLPGAYGLIVRAEYNIATGDDDPLDGERGTFDNLFPTNHGKYGYIDFIGWRNMKNLRLGASIAPAKGQNLSFDYHLFWTQTSNDDVYRASGAVLLFIPAGVTEDEIGQEFDITWSFSPAKGLGVLAGYSHFMAGDLFDVSLPEGATIEDADFVYVQATFRF